MIIDNEGKYEIVLNTKGNKMNFYAKRYGEYWRNLIGDNLILAMYFRINYLTELLEENNIKID